MAARVLLAAVTALHGLIHLLGPAKAFGWADVPLTGRMGVALGVAWLLVAVLVLLVGVLIATGARGWWVGALVAAVGSQVVIATSWSDARAGTVPNVLLVLAGLYGFAAHGPTSFEAEYRRRRRVAGPPVAAVPVIEADLDRLPAPLATYLRRTGAVDQPAVTSFQCMSVGRIRSGPRARWMTFTGEQFNTGGTEPTRLFHMDATMFGLPVDVLHVFDDGGATMRVKLLSVLPMVNAAGPDMDRAETVTIFNDLCVLAPAALVHAPVDWTAVDERRVRGTFHRGRISVDAELRFDESGDLIDFVSDDRLRADRDGKRFTQQRWSTPLSGYRCFQRQRIAGHGEGRWHAAPPEGEFTYLEFNVRRIDYDPEEGRR